MMSAPRKVLIIDDDADYRRLISEILGMHGWMVLEAEPGEAGLDIVRQQRPDIILCDLFMPCRNGLQVCRAIREDLALQHTRIVVCSGRDDETDRVAAREAGADDYLAKPVTPNELLALFSRLCADGLTYSSKNGASSGAVQSTPCLKFWGVRGSIPTPGPGTVRYGGNTSCVELRAGREIIILDAGSGLRLFGRELVTEFKDQPLHLTLLLSHTHWDHIQGLPFFQPIYQPHCHLRILGLEGARSGLVNVLSGQMENPYFPVPFGELPGNIEIVELKSLDFHVGPVRVRAHPANHPGICVGYRLFTEEGSVAFFPDNEPQCRHRGLTAIAPTKGQGSLEYARAEEQKLIEFLRDVDVLILDTQYDADEYNQHMGWGHGCVDDAVAIALQARARQIFLFHHDPDHDDEKLDRLVARARKIVAAENGALQVDVAREGAVVELRALARHSGGLAQCGGALPREKTGASL